MTLLWVWLLLFALGLLVALVTAFARNLAYLDRQAYGELLARFPDEKRAAAAKLAADPQALQFATDAFAALMLVGLVGIAFKLAGFAAQAWQAPRVVVQAGFGLATWAAFVFVTEAVPRFARFEIWRNAYLAMPGLVRASYTLYRPLVTLALALRRGDQADSDAEVGTVVERALETLAETVGLQEPILDREEVEMIRGVLELDQTEVREIMVPRVDMVAVPHTATLAEVRDCVRREGHLRLPVYEEDIDRIIGVVHVKDLYLLAPEDEAAARLASFIRQPYVVPESKNVADLLRELRTARSHLAVVVDEHGGTAGIVTLEDIVEEVVGEIGPADDLDEHPIQPAGSHSWRVSGVVSLADINDALDLNLPDQEFETVSGLIYDQVGGLPTEGQMIKHWGLRWIVEKMEGQRIVSVRISRLPQGPAESDAVAGPAA
jgi:CBS domain containing-hemolysin-like protein